MQTTSHSKAIHYDRTSFSDERLKHFYKELYVPRIIEERMLIALRQGKISKWFSAWGQEAISVGAVQALQQHEYICTMHRNLGVFTSRKIPLTKLFAQWQGKINGFTKGRDRSFHFGTKEYHIIGMISHLGAQMGVADGIALANQLKQNQEVCLVFTGDGGASEGDFHEAVNLAAVWDLPLIIVVENNCWGLSTPSKEQFKCASFADKGIGYGIEAISINGNNILEVVDTISKKAEEIRKEPKPILIECRTFRIRGHEEASGTAYYPNGLIDEWEKYDPVLNFEELLLLEGILTNQEAEAIKTEITNEVNEAWEITNAQQNPRPTIETELQDVYQDFKQKLIYPKHNNTIKMRLIDAVHHALELALNRWDNLIFMGQDIAEYGGVFKATQGFVEQFGKSRIRNTPITEAAVLGASLGLSICDFKSMVELQFGDFVTEGFNQIVNNLAKSHYRWGQNADVVIRMPTGAGVAAGPFHSQSTEAWFTHVPGLKVIYPAFPSDAKGLLLTAFEDPNPVLFFEHKYLYRSVKEEVLEEYYTIPFGKANVIHEGVEASIITYGYGVHVAQKIVSELPEHSIELIDLRSLIPLDEELIFNSIRKTGKALILHEDTYTGGFGAELAARISEHCFTDLDAPVARVTSLDSPVPFNSELEQQFLPNARLKQKLIDLLHF